MNTQEFTLDKGLRSYCVNGEVTASAGECADDEAEEQE